MTLGEPGGTVGSFAAPGSPSATDAAPLSRGAPYPDVDDMRETRAYFHMLELEDVERESDYRRMGANVSWDEGDDR